MGVACEFVAFVPDLRKTTSVSLRAPPTVRAARRMLQNQPPEQHNNISSNCYSNQRSFSLVDRISQSGSSSGSRSTRKVRVVLAVVVVVVVVAVVDSLVVF